MGTAWSPRITSLSKRAHRGGGFGPAYPRRSAISSRSFPSMPGRRVRPFPFWNDCDKDTPCDPFRMTIVSQYEEEESPQGRQASSDVGPVNRCRTGRDAPTAVTGEPPWAEPCQGARGTRSSPLYSAFRMTAIRGGGDGIQNPVGRQERGRLSLAFAQSGIGPSVLVRYPCVNSARASVRRLFQKGLTENDGGHGRDGGPS